MLRLLALALSAATARAACKATTLEFMYLQGDAVHAAIEDDIRADLAEIGITVTAKPVDKDTLNADMVAGNYDLVFSETYGAPYDPHSYIKSWATQDEAFYSALPTAGVDRDVLAAKVDPIFADLDDASRQTKWTALLQEIHNEVVALPLYGVRVPSITRRDTLSGYTPGAQPFDYGIHKATYVGSGSKIVKVSPGAQGGLFTTVGRLDPHGYRPNEFFANNFVYESLTSYGPGGAIEPALATSWTETLSATGDTYRFTLRTGVTFHDGEAFNCAAVKLNFDHVFGPPEMKDNHNWYGFVAALKDWSCDGEVFVLNTNAHYYPLLNDLTYIRPLRMLSPAAFVGGAASDPYTQNSCPTSWSFTDVTCAGVTALAGTGPWKLARRETGGVTYTGTDYDASGQDDLVVFEKNANYWGGAIDIDELHLVRYDTAAEVETALKNGDLDAVIGKGILSPTTVKELAADGAYEVQHGEESMVSTIIMNIADKDVRKAVVHAVDKNAIVAGPEMSGFESPRAQLFSRNSPYCDVLLTPAMDYDLAAAKELNCPTDSGSSSTTTGGTGGSSSSKKKTKKEDMNGFKYGILFMVLFVIALLSGLAFIVMKEKEGEPIFMDITTKTPLTPTSKVENA